jgi:2-oxoisovalerate dehydrogenase E1 component
VGHHEGDPVVGCYRTQEEMDAWAERCPIKRFGQWLVESGQATEADLKALEAEVEEEIEEAVAFARRSPQPDPATATEHTWAEPINPPLAYADPQAQPAETVVQGWLEAVRDGLSEEMRLNPHIIYFGEGTGQRGGTFAHTKGMFEEFGPQRMIDTPICELGFTGASIGASASGCRAVADVMMGDFLFEAGSQIALQAAKLRYMSNGQVAVPMIVLAGVGMIKNAGPHHSGSYYPVWAHCPGLIVVVPSTPTDAKGLIKTALRASDPVLFLEHKSLFATKGPVPVGEHFVPFGQARVARQGSDLTIVSCGLWLHRSLAAAEQLAGQGISCEVIDLRTIVPLDVETIAASVARTGKLLVVDEAHAMCGIGAEIAAVAMEHAFDDLDAPVGRLHTEPVSFPFSPPLEDAVTVDVPKIVAAARSVLEGRPPIPRRAAGASGAAVVPQPAPAGNGRPSAPGVVAKQEQEPRSEKQPPAPKPAAASADGVPLTMPNMDLTITEATVVTWLKKVGEPVRSGEAVVEMETDKAVTQVESPLDGTLVEILATEGTVVPLGGRLGTIRP